MDGDFCTLQVSVKRRLGGARIAASVCLLAVSLTLLAFLSQRLIAQLYCRAGEDAVYEGRFHDAIRLLNQALRYLPRSAEIQKYAGWGCRNAADSEPDMVRAWQLNLQARDHFQEAMSLNPLDAESVYGMAQTEMRLETLFPMMFPHRRFNPFSATAFYRKTIRLFPNTPSYQVAFVRYLAHHNAQPEVLQAAIQNLVRIFPEGCDDLLRKPFVSPSLGIFVKKGLEQAVAGNIDRRVALEKLSGMLASEGDMGGAIRRYREALDLRASRNTAGEYLHLGRLYLQNGQEPDAAICFLKGISLSQNRDQTVAELLQRYKNEGSGAMLDFYFRVKSRYPLSGKTELALIQNLIDLQQLNRAHDMLEVVNRQRPSGEGYYLLSRIAEIQKDWSGVEKNIYKATSLDPGNEQYRQVLVSVLMREGKSDLAEQELGREIADLQHPSPQLYAQRAQLRMNRKDYAGAVSDWREVIRSSPKNAGVYAQIAEAYIAMGKLREAISFYQKAVSLNPQNTTWLQRLHDLDS